MKFFGGLMMFALVCVIALLGSAFGVSSVAGRDIGFAGAGILLMVIPGVVLGALLAYPMGRSMSDKPDRQRFYVLLAAGVCGLFFGALSTRILLGWPSVHYDPMPASKGPEVYIPGEYFGASARLNTPFQVTALQPVTIKLKWTAGPWKRLHQLEVPKGVVYFPEEPAANDSRIASAPAFDFDPQDCAKLTNLDLKIGEGTFIFQKNIGNCSINTSITLPTGSVSKTYGQSIQVNTALKDLDLPPPSSLPKAQLRCDHSGLIVHCKTDDVLPVNP